MLICVYASVCGPVHTCRDQNKTVSILFYHFLHFAETGSLTDLELGRWPENLHSRGSYVLNGPGSQFPHL